VKNATNGPLAGIVPAIPVENSHQLTYRMNIGNSIGPHLILVSPIYRLYIPKLVFNSGQLGYV
jgi:hypothetical protein